MRRRGLASHGTRNPKEREVIPNQRTPPACAVWCTVAPPPPTERPLLAVGGSRASGAVWNPRKCQQAFAPLALPLPQRSASRGATWIIPPHQRAGRREATPHLHCWRLRSRNLISARLHNARRRPPVPQTPYQSNLGSGISSAGCCCTWFQAAPRMCVAVRAHTVIKQLPTPRRRRRCCWRGHIMLSVLKRDCTPQLAHWQLRAPFPGLRGHRTTIGRVCEPLRGAPAEGCIWAPPPPASCSPQSTVLWLRRGCTQLVCNQQRAYAFNLFSSTNGMPALIRPAVL